jgi:predicted Zn-dependent protease
MYSIAEKFLALLSKRNVDFGEIFIRKKTVAVTHIARNNIEQVRMSNELEVSSRTIKGGRIGFVSGSEPTEEALRPIVDKLLEVTRLNQNLHTVPEFGPPSCSHVEGIDDPYLGVVEPESGLERIKTVIDNLADNGVDLQTSVVVQESAAVFVQNTCGSEASYSHARISIQGKAVHAEDPQRAASFHHMLRKHADFLTIGEVITHQIPRETTVHPGPSGELPVVLMPSALSRMIRYYLSNFFKRRHSLNMLSPIRRKMGNCIARSVITFTDDALLPGGWRSAPMDDEGAPTHQTVLIEKGMLTNFLSNVMAAAEDQVTTTANGYRIRYNPPIIKHTNLVIAPGTAPLDELYALCKNGYIIETIQPSSTSAVPDGTFLCLAPRVQARYNGSWRLACPVKIQANIFTILHHVSAVGAVQERVLDMYLPPLAVPVRIIR